MGNSVISASRSSDVAVIDLGLRDEQLSYIVILISVSTTDGKSIIGLAVNRLLSATPSLLQSEIGVARNRSSNFLRGSLLYHYPLLLSRWWPSSRWCPHSWYPQIPWTRWSKREGQARKSSEAWQIVLNKEVVNQWTSETPWIVSTFFVHSSSLLKTNSFNHERLVTGEESVFSTSYQRINHDHSILTPTPVSRNLISAISSNNRKKEASLRMGWRGMSHLIAWNERTIGG